MSDEKAKPCPFCGEFPVWWNIKNGEKHIECRNINCPLFGYRMPPEVWNRRAPATAREDLVKALECTQADNLAIQGYIEDGCEASALAQLRSSYAKTKAALISPLPPSKSEDLARDAVVEAASALRPSREHDKYDGPEERALCEALKKWDAVRSSPPTPRKSEDRKAPHGAHGHDEGGCTHCDEYDNAIRAEVWTAAAKCIDFESKEAMMTAGAQVASWFCEIRDRFFDRAKFLRSKTEGTKEGRL